MNDDELQDFAVLALSEPYSFREGHQVRTVPLSHSGWTKLVPTCQRDGRWAIRSMLWVQNVVESEQVAVQSADFTAALLRLPDRSILVASVYVDDKEENALGETVVLLNQLIQDAHHRVGTRVDVVLAGDFNAHDQLWGGDDVSPNRQGEADPIIDLMTEWSLRSLLPRGRGHGRGVRRRRPSI